MSPECIPRIEEVNKMRRGCSDGMCDDEYEFIERSAITLLFEITNTWEHSLARLNKAAVSQNAGNLIIGYV